MGPNNALQTLKYVYTRLLACIDVATRISLVRTDVVSNSVEKCLCSYGKPHLLDSCLVIPKYY